jgi:hypothetical protein
MGKASEAEGTEGTRNCKGDALFSTAPCENKARAKWKTEVRGKQKKCLKNTFEKPSAGRKMGGLLQSRKTDVHFGLDVSPILLKATSVNDDVEEIATVGDNGIVNNSTILVCEQTVDSGVQRQALYISDGKSLEELNAVSTLNPATGDTT